MAVRTVTAVVALALAAGAGSAATTSGTSGTARVAARRDVPAVARPAADAPAWARPVPRGRAVKASPPRPAPARPVTKPVRVTPLDPDPYFRTPEAAMRYLATAYNRHDTANLRHVTTPHARRHLEEMRPVATDLRLVSCTRWANGQHECVFTHAYPDKAGLGKAWLVASPAARRGWFMTKLEGCG